MGMHLSNWSLWFLCCQVRGKIKADSIEEQPELWPNMWSDCAQEMGHTHGQHPRSPSVGRCSEQLQDGIEHDLARVKLCYFPPEYKSNLFHISFLKNALLLYLSF